MRLVSSRTGPPTMTPMKRPAILTRRIAPLALACAAVLAGCGGGGGSNGDAGQAASSKSDISSANYASFTSPLARSVVDASGGSSFSGLVDTSRASSLHAPVGYTAALAGRAMRLSAGTARPAQTTSETINCDFGGTMQVSVDDADNNQTLSKGDSISIVATACRLEAGGAVASGSMSMRLDALQLDTKGSVLSLQASGSFAGLTVGTDALSGSFSASATTAADGSTSVSMAYSDMAVTSAAGNLHFDISFTGQMSASGAMRYSVNGQLEVGGERYTLQQMEPFTVSGAHPTSGSVRLSDAAGDAIWLTAKPDDKIDFAFYPAGAATPAAQLTGRSWSEFGG